MLSDYGGSVGVVMKPPIPHFTVIGLEHVCHSQVTYGFMTVPLVWSGPTSILKFRRFVCARILILRHRRVVCVFCNISRSLDLNEFAAT